MQVKQLDLKDERCPMSLLLVKRAYKALGVGEAMSIVLVEPQSVTDVSSYLGMQTAKVDKQTRSDVTTISVLKQGV
ncbi:sulfurtransferase TusA family protein [Vibrio hippocampi]|uniref:UPF0033 domain-containing protein n=1 Tax=Vibrio hippocampi TaxID=654686 RepID=A0ABM8ZEP6_9VIBR|nr:sulfurtransferase TusA family protein [Vibrio hippocampi]CAH0524983.1 hypothetical protein VHP8226_00659 [Vibrio hippocampi]